MKISPLPEFLAVVGILSLLMMGAIIVGRVTGRSELSWKASASVAAVLAVVGFSSFGAAAWIIVKYARVS